MKKLLEYVAQSITGNENIKVVESKSGDLNIYTIQAPKEVIGILIGKEGRTIRAIRALARARAIIDQVGINIILEEAA